MCSSDLLVPPKDPAALGKAAIELLENEGPREAQVNAAIERTKSFDKDNVALLLKSYYQQMLAGT